MEFVWNNADGAHTVISIFLNFSLFNPISILVHSLSSSAIKIENWTNRILSPHSVKCSQIS